MKTKQWISVSLIAISTALAGCASGYKEFYSPNTGIDQQRIAALRAAPPPAQPLVERASPGSFDEIINAYAKRGYGMIGSSNFNSGRDVSEDGAVLQGKSVGADLVLILNPKYTGSVTSSIPITTPTTSTTYSNSTATAYGSGGSVTAYGSGVSTTYGTSTNYIPMTVNRVDYGAIYFVKRKYGLGASFRDLNDTERQELQTNRGAVARLIVDGTPAFNADLLIGDVFTSIDGVSIVNTQTLGALLQERAGKAVTFSIMRRGQSIQKLIQLNP
jgi:PDZ domain